MRAFALIPVLLLAACGDGAKEGTAISITGADNSFSAEMGSRDGTIAIKAPGFSGAIDLPKIQLDAGNFDIDGVRLPEGSKIRNLNVVDRGEKEAVEVRFSSPVAPGAVLEHFRGRLAGKGYTLTTNGAALTGTTDEGKSFRLSSRGGAGGSESVLSIGG
ncbi:hypothetical protein SAMN06297144_1571 [Sphingomonas guangdongensis]|uniref:Lipoprotein n=1 Tax=Sphingomonas guangdongensis TaxID=1141890 RepID=A0A285QXB4_9SPHN|nr:hypothetical protein [Sphingomonas guangdongensis]SOB86466.1 hypothetical protein SAMN06297144_1571 [Sphingomonas guangdongensis]